MGIQSIDLMSANLKNFWGLFQNTMVVKRAARDGKEGSTDLKGRDTGMSQPSGNGVADILTHKGRAFVIEEIFSDPTNKLRSDLSAP